MSAQVGAQVGAQTTFDAWVASKGDAVGPPGTTSVLTPLAARELWDREARGADVLDDASVQRLDAVIRADVKRATAFQALLRGRVDRRKAPAATPSASRNELAPFNPTPEAAVAKALELLDVGEGDVVYDVGCGDGRFVVAAAKRGAEAVGVELDAALAKRAREAVAGLAGARIVQGDALAEPLDRATKVFLYLVPSGLKTIVSKLAALRNVTVVAYTFAVPGWAPDRREVVGGISLYLYLPRRVFTCGACQLTLVGDAKFTYVDGPSRIEGTYTEDAGDFIFKWPSKAKKGVLRSLDFERRTFDEPLVDEGVEE